MNGRHLVKSIGWAFVEALGLILLSFITLLVLARLLGPIEFGRACAVVAVAQLMGIFVEQLFAEVLVQRAEIRKDHVESAFWTSLGIATVFVASCFIFAPMNPDKEFGRLLCAASLGLLPSAYSGVQSALLRRVFDFRTLALRTLAGRVLGAVFGLTLAFGGAGAWSIISQQLVTATLGAAILWYWTPRRIGRSFNVAAVRETIGFALTTLASEALIIASPKVYQLLAAYFLGIRDFGYLSIGFRLVETMRELIGHASSNIGLPLFSRLQHQKEELQRQFVWATSAVCLIAMPSFIGLAVCGSDVVRVTLGETWLPAVPVMQILAVGAAAGSLSTFCFTLLSAYGRPAPGLLRGAFDLVFTLSLLPAAAGYGMEAVALVWAFRHAASSILALGLCVRVVAVQIDHLVLSLLGPVTVAAGIGAALWAMDRMILSGVDSAIQRLLISASTGGFLLMLVTAAQYRNVIALLMVDANRRKD